MKYLWLYLTINCYSKLCVSFLRLRLLYAMQLSRLYQQLFHICWWLVTKGSVQALAGMVRIQERLLKNFWYWSTILMLSHHLDKILPVFAITKLCFSYNPLPNENFADVTLTTLFIVSGISKSLNWPTLIHYSSKNFPGAPY